MNHILEQQKGSAWLVKAAKAALKVIDRESIAKHQEKERCDQFIQKLSSIHE